MPHTAPPHHDPTGPSRPHGAAPAQLQEGRHEEEGGLLQVTRRLEAPQLHRVMEFAPFSEISMQVFKTS